MDGSTLTASDWFNDLNRLHYTIFADDATRAAARNTLFTAGTVTVSTPVVAATQTWNDGAVTFIGDSHDFTDTASAAASLLQRWRAGAAGTTLVMQLGKGGLLELPLALSATTGIRLGADVDIYRDTANLLRTPDSLTVDGNLNISSGTITTVGALGRMDFAAGGLGISFGTYVGRATTNPTNSLNLFDGNAPVGTLTNGVTLYSAAGELRVMDAGGTSTLLSPHDEEGAWVYDSVSPITGKHLRIDMEKMLKKINSKFHWNFIHECVND